MAEKIKIALNAGHYLYTAGKRVSKIFDSNETREWVLNDRICDKLERELEQYNVSIIRLDDTYGEKNISLANRAASHNAFKPDVGISFHHNAGVNGTSGGGVVVYYNSKKGTSTSLAQSLYNNIVACNHLVGNRAQKIKDQTDLYETNNSVGPYFLVENGFMDSSTDAPIILTDNFANQTVQGVLNFLIKEFGIKKLDDKKEPDLPITKPQEVFINQIAPYVQKHSPAYDIKVNSPAIGQSCLECGFGTSLLAKEANNFFGIKYKPGRCPGASQLPYYKPGSEQNPDGTYTDSMMAWFQFPNMEQSVIGYFDFINNTRYASLKGETSPYLYLEKIKACGYASSNDYVSKVYNLIQTYDLTRFDNKAPEEPVVSTYYKYTVYKGDTLTKIANSYGVAISTIVMLNNIANPNKIKTGDVLYIPKVDQAPPTVTFKDGDLVKIVPGATWWDGKVIPSWVYTTPMYYRGANANGIIISRLKTGAITGVLKAQYVYK